MDENYSFGYWVRRRRKALDLTQAALARRINCTLSMIRKIEADERRASLETIDLLAAVLEIPHSERETFRKVGRGERGAERLASVPLQSFEPQLRNSDPTTHQMGTVTFMLTDVEGSTLLWERFPDQAGSMLERHDRLIERIVAGHAGVLIRPRGEGDSRFAVFKQATEAIAAAASIQERLASEPWPASIPVRVRIGLHTGEAEWRDGDYYGPAVNRCARLRASAHGGQTLLSSLTAGLVGNQLPAGARLHSLGMYQLRDIATPDRIYQLSLAGLPGEFPELRAERWRKAHLPVWPTPLIDRESETEAASTYLMRSAVRLLVMTGPGGAGKTRLAIRVAQALGDAFEDGVIFVSLSTIADPELVLPTIAQALDIKESGEQSLLLSIEHHLADQHLLLVLDNFEQVLPAAPLVAELLQAVPRLSLLVTSRAVLGVYGEQELPVPPLELPTLDPLPTPEVVAAFPAVALFLQCAKAALPAFRLTGHNAAAIAEICVRLDGLPLALELAAARSRLLPPSALLKRLDRRLPMLVGGGRDQPPRQRTLRDTIAWSYDLLEHHEKVIFAQLSVFVGGWSLPAAETLLALPDDVSASVVDRLQSLLDKSLIQRVEPAGEQPRFVMLETIREYAEERMVASGDEDALRRRHSSIFLALAEAAHPELRGPGAGSRLGELARDDGNLRAALQWALERGEAETAARLASALWPFWYARSSLSEGRRWITAVLKLTHQVPDSLRSSLLYAAGVLAAEQGNLREAQNSIEESLVLRRTSGDARGIGASLLALGNMAQMQGELERATDFYEQSLPLFKVLHDAPGIASVLNNLGVVALAGGNAPRARTLHEESLVILRDQGDSQGIASALSNLARIAFHERDDERVHALLAETLDLWAELGNAVGVAEGLEGLASLAAASDPPEPGRAARLWGAAEQIRTTIDAPLSPIDRPRYEQQVAQARQHDPQAFTIGWTEGRALSLDQAIAYALARPSPA